MDGWRSLNVGVVGGGIGGLSVAIALRRSGHAVTIYEKNDFAGETGASISCAANGTQWLNEWDVNVDKGDPYMLKKMISRDWKTGEPVSLYDLKDYTKRWGYPYYAFHRQAMHSMLKDCAMQREGEGQPAVLLVNHACQDIDLASGTITFKNGSTITHDLIIGADGIGSVVRGVVGIFPEKKPSDQSCLHVNISTEQALNSGFIDYTQEGAMQYWGGQEMGLDKIVMSPCNGGKTISCYCFFPRTAGDYTNHSWGGQDRPVEELLAPYPKLDRSIFNYLSIGKDIRPWRLWIHDPYPYLHRSMVCLLGDAGHPMMPHQSQGVCMALEDAGALGVLFNKNNFRGDISETLAAYTAIRLPRVTRVQSAAARATYNLNERIGFSHNKDTATYKVKDEKDKLTIEELNSYNMHQHIEEYLAMGRNEPYRRDFVNGMPVGLKLPSGIITRA